MPKPKTLISVTVELRQNDHGDRDIHIDESGAHRYEIVGILTDAIHEIQRRYPAP